jgi:Calcium binding
MKMKAELDPEREERVTMEIIVDAYGPEEQAMGWYYYLKDTIAFPFSAVCCERRSISPLKTGEKVVVVGMADEGECDKEMFVDVRWGKIELAVPLSQLTPISSVPEATREAVDDWHYWVKRGYQLC